MSGLFYFQYAIPGMLGRCGVEPRMGGRRVFARGYASPRLAYALRCASIPLRFIRRANSAAGGFAPFEEARNFCKKVSHFLFVV